MARRQSHAHAVGRDRDTLKPLHMVWLSSGRVGSFLRHAPLGHCTFSASGCYLRSAFQGMRLGFPKHPIFACIDNYIGALGAAVLVQRAAGQRHAHPKHPMFACSDNYIGALGAAVLANALKGNATLTGLHIKGNELGNEGVKALCEAFRARGARVTALDFGNNRRAA